MKNMFDRSLTIPHASGVNDEPGMLQSPLFILSVSNKENSPLAGIRHVPISSGCELACAFSIVPQNPVKAKAATRIRMYGIIFLNDFVFLVFPPSSEAVLIHQIFFSAENHTFSPYFRFLSSILYLLQVILADA